jgi:hypothetical protein
VRTIVTVQSGTVLERDHVDELGSGLCHIIVIETPNDVILTAANPEDEFALERGFFALRSTSSARRTSPPLAQVTVSHRTSCPADQLPTSYKGHQSVPRYNGPHRVLAVAGGIVTIRFLDGEHALVEALPCLLEGVLCAGSLYSSLS